MRTFAIAAFATAAFASGPAAARDGMTEIGKIDNRSGLISAVILERNERKSAAFFVADRHRIKTNMIGLDKQELLKLRELIDATIAELDAASPAPEATPAKP